MHAGTPAAGTEPALTVVDNNLEQSFTVAQLKVKLQSTTISFAHPYYEKEKSFEGFALGPFLKEMFQGQTAGTGSWKVRFEALDGYRSETPWDKLFEYGGYLVFRDLDYPQWEEMKKRKVLPGPFAVVWTQREQTADAGYPWPWQIETVRLIRE